MLGGFSLYEEAIDFDDDKRGRSQMSVRPESPPSSGSDGLLDAIEGKVAPEPEAPAVDAEIVDLAAFRCPHGIALTEDGGWFDRECPDCANEDKAAVCAAEVEESRRR